MKKFMLNVLLVVPIFASNQISIESSYQKALSYEASLQSYGYQVLAKGEEVKQAKSRLYPKIDIQTSATSRKYTLNNSGIDRKENFYTLTLSGSLPIYHPEYYNIINQSKLKHEYTSIYFEQLKQELAFNVTDTFMQIIRAQKSLSVAKAYLETNKRRHEQIKKMYDKRLSNKIDLLSSKVTYDQSKIKVNIEKNSLRISKLKFLNLTGISDAKMPDTTLESIDMSKLSLNYSEKDLIESNLEIKKSNLNIELTKKQIDNSNYGHYPKVDLTASASAYDPDNIYTDYTDDSKIVLSMKIPIYQGGYVESDVAKYRYLLSASVEDLSDIKRKVIANYKEMLLNLNTSKENIMLYRDAIKSSELYLVAVNKSYEKGLKNLIDVDDAKTKLFESKFKLIDSVYLYIKSYTSLLNTFGLLSEEKLKQLDRSLFVK